jgi:cytoplasmic iron level regulating protein YaaA (DUF328/UPF0246 family)
MLVLTAPAKTLDESTPYSLSFNARAPRLLGKAEQIATLLKSYDLAKFRKTLAISDKLAAPNFERYQHWDAAQHQEPTARPALFCYDGDIYEKMEPYKYTPSMQLYAEKSVRILSGLYGVLSGFELMLPYRLEMKQKLPELLPEFKSLAEFWRDAVTDLLNADLAETPQDTACLVVNLASEEYAAAVDFSRINAPVLKIDFFTSDHKGRKRMVPLHSKHARGLMLDFMIKNEVKKPGKLLDFQAGGYKLTDQQEHYLAFTRSA